MARKQAVVTADTRVIQPKANKESLLKTIKSLSIDSYVTASSEFVNFTGLGELGKICHHVMIENSSDSHVIFYIDRPPPSYFAVTPKIGYLAPTEKCEVAFLFTAKCFRVPDDLIWMYSIFQKKIAEDKTAIIRDDKYTTKQIRKAWRETTESEGKHVLRMAVTFALKCDGDRCEKQHNLRKTPNLDNKGEMVPVDEVPFDPENQRDDEQNYPSAAED